jgi:hypothetical protein
MGATIEHGYPFLTASYAYAKDVIVLVSELKCCWARANASRLAGAGARSRWEISQQCKSTNMLGQSMSCRTVILAMYDKRWIKPRLQGEGIHAPVTLPWCCGYAPDARQRRPRPRTCEPNRLLLRWFLWGMLHCLGKDRQGRGIVKKTCSFLRNRHNAPRTCMFALQSCRARMVS